MIVSFHRSLAGGADLGLVETVNLARDAGFDAVDLVLGEVVERPAGQLRSIIEKAELVAGGAPLPVEYRRDARTFEEGLERLPQLAALAAEVGVKTVSRSVPASAELPKDEMLALLRRRLVACADILREHGVRLALEPLGPLHLRRSGAHELIWRLPEVADFALSCGPDVGVLVDSWHWHHAGDSVEDILDVGERILHVHIADAPALAPESIRDDERLLPGEGVVDLAAFLGAVRETGYDGAVTPEVHGYRLAGGDALSAALSARAAVAGVLDGLPVPSRGGGGGGGG